MNCKHKRTFHPPLAQRPRLSDGTRITASMIPCLQCIQESNAQFYTKLRTQAELERNDPNFNPLAPFIKGVKIK